MSKLIVNAPIQNREFNPDERLGKVVPLFVSAHLRGEEDYLSDPVDLWNNVIAAEQKGYDASSYSGHSRELLAQKYGSSVLTHLQKLDGESEVTTDDDPGFTSWATKIIQNALDAGDIQIRDESVFACNGCEATLALASGPQPERCHCCTDSTGVALANRPVMIAAITSSAVEAAAVATHQSVATGQTGRSFIVNKRRVSGIGLEWAGFPDDVVDPRIGVGLLGLYAAAMRDAGSVDLVSSRAAMTHNLQQLFAATNSQTSDLPRLGMLGIAKAPAGYLTQLTSEGVLSVEKLVQVLRDRIAPQLIKMQKDMSPQCAEQIIFSRRSK